MVELDYLDQGINRNEFESKANKILNIAITLGKVCPLV